MKLEYFLLPKSDLRLDRLLPTLSSSWTRSQIRPLFEQKHIWALSQEEGSDSLATYPEVKSPEALYLARPLRPSERLPEGTWVAVQVDDLTHEELSDEAENIPLDIRYEDEDLLIINKPVGLVVHPAPGHPKGTLVNALRYHYGQNLSDQGGQERPGIVHRIDRDTSGLLVVAKNNWVHRQLSAAIAEHAVRRQYECIVLGRFNELSGTIDAPIGRDPVHRQRQMIMEQGKAARTHFRLLDSFRQASHLRVDLETGRTHQIRVHMAYIHHPIVGDPLYGSPRQEAQLKLPPLPAHSGQLLHAAAIHLEHPRTGKELEITCELPPHFEAYLAKLRQDMET